MNVEEFVSENLKQIAKGLISAQKSGVMVTGVGHYNSQTRGLPGSQGYHQQEIMFDIAVTVSDNVESGGKAGITVWSIGAEAKTKKQTTSNTVSRIQFKVPVFYPSSDKIIE